MARRSRWSAWLAGLVVCAVAGAASAPAVAAFSYSIPLSRVASGAGAAHTWQGTLGGPCGPYLSAAICLDQQVRGTLQIQASIFREIESDPAYDYYVGQAKVPWTLLGGWDAGWANAPATIAITVDKVNQGGIYDAASTAVSGGSCAAVTVGAVFGWFGISATPTLCSTGAVVLDGVDGHGAIWGSTNVARTPRWDVWFATKILAGQKPTFSFIVTYPVYSYRYVTFFDVRLTKLSNITALSLKAP